HTATYAQPPPAPRLNQPPDIPQRPLGLATPSCLIGPSPLLVTPRKLETDEKQRIRAGTVSPGGSDYPAPSSRQTACAFAASSSAGPLGWMLCLMADLRGLSVWQTGGSRRRSVRVGQPEQADRRQPTSTPLS